MAIVNKQDLLDYVNNNIDTNGANEITGEKLNKSLIDFIDTIFSLSAFLADQNVFESVNTFETDVNVGRRIYHYNDSNTYIEFTSDKVEFVIGGQSVMTLTESGGDVTIAFGGKVSAQDGVANDELVTVLQLNNAKALKLDKPDNTTITDADTIDLDWDSKLINNSLLTTARSAITVTQSNVPQDGSQIPIPGATHRLFIKLDTGASTVTLTFSDVTINSIDYSSNVAYAATRDEAVLIGSAGDVFVLHGMYDGFGKIAWRIENTAE